VFLVILKRLMAVKPDIYKKKKPAFYKCKLHSRPETAELLVEGVVFVLRLITHRWLHMSPPPQPSAVTFIIFTGPSNHNENMAQIILRAAEN
jgi:hypothetical protein